MIGSGRWFAAGLVVCLVSRPGVAETQRPRQLAAPAIGDEVNVPIDTDGDGHPDRARVGDWDGDGTLEMADIQQAIDALTDPGDKLVEILAGEFAPPPSPGADILRLPSRLTLRGGGPGVTVLHGYPGTDLVSTGSVIANDGPYTGNEEIAIADLEIDGGWGSGDASGLGHARTGILFSQCHSCRAERVTVRDTLHSCLYSKNGDDVRFHDNTLLRCGNYTGQGQRFPCVYLFANEGLTQQDVHVTDNVCVGAGHAGLNTRTNGALHRDLLFAGNWTMDTRIVDGQAEGCIVVGGVTDATYLDNGCLNTGSLWVQESSDVVVDGLVIDTAIGTHGVQILGSRDLTLRRLSIAHTAGYGIVLLRSVDGSLPDHEDLTIEDSSLADAGGWGIAGFEPMVLENVRIEGNVLDGIDHGGIGLTGAASPPSHDVRVRGNVVRDFGRAPAGPVARGISISGPVQALDVRDNVVEDVGDQAEYGIVHGVWPVGSDLSYLCRNEFLGTLETEEYYYVSSAVAVWQADPDLDTHVDACDCDDADANTHPDAHEINEAKDNQCPGNLGHGVVDEISGVSGFLDPSERNEFSWIAQPGAIRYEVLRSRAPDLSAPCAGWLTTGTEVTDPGTPVPEGAYYYLVRAQAPNVGSWGRASAGAERRDLCVPPAAAGKRTDAGAR